LCTFRLCESCGIIYAKGRDIVDILLVRRPPNNNLWSVFYDNYTKKQKVIPLHKSRQDYSWNSLKGFSSNEVKALNFAKAIPLDCKFMVIIGGTSNTVFPDQAPKPAKINMFLVDLFNNEIYIKKTINKLRLFAACARGGREQPSRIYMIGGQDQETGKWTNIASYIDIIDVMKSKPQNPAELLSLSAMPYTLIGPTMYLARTNMG
jgi:hypothetical protein